MLIGIPKAIPEIPVRDVEKAAEYYVDVLGFSFDWGDDQGGIGASRRGSAECS
jgi:catechol 2,3-dioxygenase-like lactoylglutathione lyase family enzyme